MNSLEQPDPASLGCKSARVFSHPLCLSLLLAVVTLAVYWRALSCEFIDYDDPDYFSNNPHVLAGLNGSGIRWAFTTYSSANWHPLTWLSLMLDATLFGTGPAGPHLTNVLLHTANVFLLFWVLWRLTMKIWPSAAVAALFALHPLHVESVAWVAERKDVLSGFFFMLTLLAYTSYVRQATGKTGTPNIEHRTLNAEPGKSCITHHASRFYILSLFFFALGLMSKPMLVTLPLVLLLLDYWPLKRFTFRDSLFTIWPRVSEKIPFFLLSAASCVITFIAQHQGGAVVGLTRLSVSLRVENAFVSYARYLGKTFWPAALANPYPHPEFWLANPPPGFWSAGLVGFSVALFAGLSVAAVWCWRKFPFVTVGWLWYVGTLVPVIGLVQVGTQSMADRYTYLPLIGVFIILSWGVAELQARWRLSRRGIACLAALLLVACAARARNQIGFWQNDGSLFFHALTVTRNNYVACVNLGTWFSKNGQIEETLRCYYMALKMNPSDPSVLYDVGNAFAKIGYWDEAISQYRRALEITPNEPDILNNLGLALSATRQYSEAVTNFEAALKLKPDLAGAHNNFAAVLYVEHRFAEAAQHYREAIRLTPDDPRIHVNLGDTLVRLGQPAEAAKAYQTALQLNPGDPQITAKLQALDKPVSN
jgi:Flp pilus assembly protein TadD